MKELTGIWKDIHRTRIINRSEWYFLQSQEDCWNDTLKECLIQSSWFYLFLFTAYPEFVYD
jgi:hypothetical protein